MMSLAEKPSEISGPHERGIPPGPPERGGKLGGELSDCDDDGVGSLN